LTGLSDAETERSSWFDPNFSIRKKNEQKLLIQQLVVKSSKKKRQTTTHQRHFHIQNRDTRGGHPVAFDSWVGVNTLRNIEWRDLDGNSVATGTESQTLKKKMNETYNSQGFALKVHNSPSGQG
jgi:hypothetical protein